MSHLWFVWWMGILNLTLFSRSWHSSVFGTWVSFSSLFESWYRLLALTSWTSLSLAFRLMARVTRVSLIFQVSCFRLIHFNLALLYSSWYRLMCSNSVLPLLSCCFFWLRLMFRLACWTGSFPSVLAFVWFLFETASDALHVISLSFWCRLMLYLQLPDVLLAFVWCLFIFRLVYICTVWCSVSIRLMFYDWFRIN